LKSFRAFHALLFVIAATSIGLASILVRLSEASATACAFWRLFIASAVLFTITALRNDFAELRRGYIYTIASGIALAAHFILWMDSLFRVSVAVSTTIVVIYPAHLMFAEVLQGERIRFGAAIGLLLAFSSVALLFSKSLALGYAGSAIGVAESFLASVCAAIYFYIGRISRRNMSTSGYASMTYLVAAITTLIYSLAIGDNVFSYLSRSWHWFLALALVPMIGGHTVMNYLLRFYSASTVTSIALTEPITASILASLLLGESIGIIEVIALAMSVTGVYIVLKSGSASK
jgi:drug/metabolite transporter (DMT)-like permease